MYPYITFAGVSIRTFMLFLAAGIILCLMIFLTQNWLFSLKIYELIESLPFALGFSLLGGKLLSFITVFPLILREHRTGLEAFLSIGFVYYGGFIGLGVGLYLESKRRSKALLNYTDSFFRLLPIGQAFGRIGCYFNGCCYGMINSSWLGIPYLVNGTKITVVPIQFIEAVFCLILGICLLRFKSEKRGIYTWVYIYSYSIFRFIIEFFRGDTIRGVWGGLSTSQWISIALIVGCAAINSRAKQKQRGVWFAEKGMSE